MKDEENPKIRYNRKKNHDQRMKMGSGSMSIDGKVIADVMQSIFYESKRNEMIYAKPMIVWVEERLMYMEDVIKAAQEIGQAVEQHWLEEKQWLENLVYNLRHAHDMAAEKEGGPKSNAQH